MSIPDLGLVFGQAGLTVSKSGGQVVRTFPWTALSALSSEHAELAGPNGALLRVVTPERSHRFVVPAVDPVDLDLRLADVSRHYGRGAGAAAEPVAAEPTQVPEPMPVPEPAAVQQPWAPLEPSEQASAEPAGAGTATAAQPVVVEPLPGAAGQRKVSGARRRNSLIVLVVLLVVVAVLAGLYFAQRQGLIHFLPKSIVSPPASSSASPNGQGSAANLSANVATTVPATPIPGLTIPAVTAVVQPLGLTCVQSASSLTSCAKSGSGTMVQISSVPGGSVRLVTARVSGATGGPEAVGLFRALASVPYQGALPAEAAAWAALHASTTARTQIGAAVLSVTALSGQSLLQITGA